MWPLGHAAVGYLCLSLGADSDLVPDPDAIAVALVLLGAQLPDLVDKPLAWELAVLPAGRSLGHSLLFLVPAIVVAVGLTRWVGRPAAGIALAVGLLSHVFVDATPVLWDAGATWEFLLWPLLHVEGTTGSPSILAMLRESTTDPWFLLEFPLAVLALVRWRQDGSPGLRPRFGSAEASP